MSKKGLGNGLSHLLEQNISDNLDKEILEIPIANIKPNPYQPRKTFDEVALNELAASIKENGLFQPILLRQTLIGYEIISGERRYRASKIAGLEKIPAIIYDYNDTQMMEVAIVENIQREDLSVVEEAKSYQMLIDNLNYTQEQVAQKVGKSRSYIANILRLLKLDQNIIELIDQNKLTLGHVKTLINIEDKKMQQEIVNQIITKHLNVRDSENLIKEYKNPQNKKVKVPNTSIKNLRNKRLETTIREKLGVQVAITGSDKGKIVFNYNSCEELESLLQALNLI